MITTSPATSPAFQTLDIAVLLSVQGGCGKKQSCNCSQQVIVAPPAPAPAPVPMAPPPMPRESISTSVSVSYQ